MAGSTIPLTISERFWNMAPNLIFALMIIGFIVLAISALQLASSASPNPVQVNWQATASCMNSTYHYNLNASTTEAAYNYTARITSFSGQLESCLVKK